jgi:hypothetical protein
MADTRHEWLTELAALSPTIRSISKPADEIYFDRVTKVFNNADAFNLSASAETNEAIARWCDGLVAEGAPVSQVEKHLIDLTSRNTYGTFSELAAYGLLLDAEIPFETQVTMTGKSILNSNGSDLDGKLTIGNDVYFDVKAFGLHEHRVKILTEKLSAQFPTEFIAVNGSADVSVSVLADLLGKDFSALAAELHSKALVTRGDIEFRREVKRSVNSTIRFANAYRLAENHADYVFRFAKQFPKRKPFMLIFVIHSWLGGFRLSNGFDSDAKIFMRSFARRAFMQFVRDRTIVQGVTRAHASKLLSGIMFIDAWQGPSEKKREHALFLNPYAKSRISRLTSETLVHSIRGLLFDDFQHDKY